MTEYERPRIEDAPGLTWKKRRTGWEARWAARTDLIVRGYEIKSVRLWLGCVPMPVEVGYIQDQCRRLQDEMLIWGRGGIRVLPTFDGGLASLIDCYQTDADSGYQVLRYRTRENYNCLCRRLAKEHGLEPVRDIDARMLKNWHREWSATGHVSMSHSLISMLRTLATFGATYLKSKDCRELKILLADMRFPMAKARVAFLTAEHAIAIREQAHKMGLHSLALAQAIQFDCMLRQKDVIGEWVPMSEPGVSDVIDGNDKWLRGIRWEEISDGLILRHTTSKKQKDIEVDLKLAPMAMEELQLIPNLQTGPVVVYEGSGKPYITHQFRRLWREVANQAGVPKGIRNMDSRAGAITEATEAGADLEHVRQAATHGDTKMTMHYSRGAAEKTATVMKLRSAHRNKPRT